MLIAGGRVVDPAQRIDALLDVRIRDGAIAQLGEHLHAENAERVVDAANAIVAPGFIDMHVHLREPGQPEKETIATGTAAAAGGGFTAVAAMPNTQPAIDNAGMVRWVAERALHDASTRVYCIGAITRERAGVDPADFEAMADAGAVAFSDDGSSIESSIVQMGAALRARATGRPFITHCEDPKRKTADEFDPSAESSTVLRDVTIATATQQPWHIAHVSTAAAILLIEAAKRSSTPVSCEVTPHHLYFTRGDARSLPCVEKVHPPLRDATDRDALKAAVQAGTIDVFASDHAPHADDTSPGFSGLEIAVGAYALAVPTLPVTRFVEMLSMNPARILGITGGTLAIGSPADVTIFADRPWVVEPLTFYSKGRRTPFAGMTLPRRAIATIVAGDLVMHNGSVAVRAHG